MNQLNTSQNPNIVIEFRESDTSPFAFKYKKGEKLTIGSCEYCNKTNIMRSTCKCKNVKYCDDECLEKDKRFHVDKCSAMADGVLGMDDNEEISENSKKGLVGLSNLGNTCYMNSSI